MSRDPLLYVADIVAAGEAILRYTDGVAFDAIGSNDEKRSDVERQVFIFSEAAALLPEEWKLQPIEQQYRDLKDELGWDHFEGRTFRGWNHHVVLTAIGFTFLQLEPRRAPNAGPPTLPRSVSGSEIMAMLSIASHRLLLNLAISFQRDPPLRI